MFIECLGRAKASAGELRAQLHLSLEIGYLEQSEFEGAFSLAEECSKEIRGLMRYLETKPNAPRIRRGDTRNPPTENSSEA